MIHLDIFVRICERRERKGERQREGKRNKMSRISMTRKILKEEGCSAYCLSPNRFKQDVDVNVDVGDHGRIPVETGQAGQFQQAAAATGLTDYGSQGDATVNK